MKIIDSIDITMYKDQDIMYKQARFSIRLDELGSSIIDTIAKSRAIFNTSKFVKVRPILADNGTTLMEIETPFVKIVAKGLDIIAIVFNAKIRNVNEYSLVYNVRAKLHDRNKEPEIGMYKYKNEVDLLEYMRQLLKAYRNKHEQLENGWYNISPSAVGIEQLAYKQDNKIVYINAYSKQINNTGYIVLDLTGNLGIKKSPKESLLDYIVINDNKDCNSFLALKHQNIFKYEYEVDKNSDIIRLIHNGTDIYIDLLKDNIMTLIYKLYKHIDLLNGLRESDDSQYHNKSNDVFGLCTSLNARYTIRIDNIDIAASMQKIDSIYMAARFEDSSTHKNVFIHKHGEQERSLSDLLTLINVTNHEIALEAKGSIYRKTIVDLREELCKATRYRDKAIITVMEGNSDDIDYAENIRNEFQTKWSMTVYINNLFDLPKVKEHIYESIDTSKSLTLPSIIIDVQRLIIKRTPSDAEKSASKYVTALLVYNIGSDESDIKQAREIISGYYTPEEIIELANKLRRKYGELF